MSESTNNSGQRTQSLRRFLPTRPSAPRGAIGPAAAAGSPATKRSLPIPGGSDPVRPAAAPVQGGAGVDLIADYHRTQGLYTQTRHFTPGEQVSEVPTLRDGQPRTMDLLVVVHNDVEGADEGVRVDVQADIGPSSTGKAYENAHLVNTYDEQAGITHHTAVYPHAELEAIKAAAGASVHNMLDLDFQPGGVPGATIYSVRAQMKPVDGKLVIDTTRPMSEGPGVSRYSLHDQQESMNHAAWDRGNVPAAQRSPVQPESVQPESVQPESVQPESARATNRRLGRFPELRGIKALAGIVARFPEQIGRAHV